MSRTTALHKEEAGRLAADLDAEPSTITRKAGHATGDAHGASGGNRLKEPGTGRVGEGGRRVETDVGPGVSPHLDVGVVRKGSEDHGGLTVPAGYPGVTEGGDGGVPSHIRRADVGLHLRGSDGEAAVEGSSGTDGPSHTHYSDTTNSPSYADPGGGTGVGLGVPSYADGEIPASQPTASTWALM